jgi:RNA polymerase sigma-70 factor (ECF subfamily)
MADQATFEADAVPYMRALFGHAVNLSGNVADAEDLVSETFLNAYRAYGSFDGENLKAWLFKILNNNWKNALRTRSRRPQKALLGEDEEVEEHYFMTRTTPEDVALDQMTAELVRAAIDELPDAYRETVLLADVEGFTYAEIAAIEDVPIGTIMSRLHRGRKSLQKALYEYAVDSGIVRSEEGMGVAP